MFKERLYLFSFLLIFFTVSKGENSFFLAKQYGFDNYVCATNSTYALSWIFERVTERLQINSNYKPTPPKSDFTWNIKNDVQTTQYFIKKPWTLQNSVDLRLNDVIVDERWEDLPVIKTEFTATKYASLEYINGLKLPSSDFEIPLSIRIEKEAHIFLCDGENSTESRCYWFLLQAFGGNASAIRKCEKNLIPSIEGKYPEGNCKIRRVDSTHTQDFLTHKKWSHFVLSNQDQTLRFSAILNNRKSTILEWKDTDNPIGVTDLILHSKFVNGLWKVHNIDFIYTREKDNVVDLGPPIEVADGKVCVSMYILMCPSCEIRLWFQNTNHEQTFKSVKSSWNRIKFVVENVSLAEVQLRVHTINSKEEGYWAIDKVRLCQKEEFRIIGLSEKAKCQLLSSTDVIEFDLEKVPSLKENKCPENTVGDFCMPCEMIFDGCKQITVCDKDQCVCSAGYTKSPFYECITSCTEGTYGHGCQKNCGHCYDTCNNIDGTCSFCNEKYSGPKCDIPDSIFFTQPPSILEISYQEVIVSMLDFTVIQATNAEEPDSYTFQYKKAQNFISEWININQKFVFREHTNFTIDNLDPETRYYVRAVITLKDGKEQLGDHLKFSEFTTNCKDISEENIKVDTTNTTAFVTLVQTTIVMCKQYSVSLYEKGQTGQSYNNGTFFENLNPYTTYTVIFQRKEQTQQKKFKTEEGVPTPVRNLSATTLTSTSIELKWEEPEQLNGEFKQYTVEYQHLKNMGCNFSKSISSERDIRITKNTYTKLTNLKPYSTYVFYVSLENGKSKGESSIQNATTEFSNEIKNEEIPTVSSIKTSAIGARIYLTEIKCEQLSGPLYVNITSNCLSEWCKSLTNNSKTENRTLSTTIGLNALLPFSNYNVEIKFCRKKEVCSRAEKKNFTTEASVPTPVKNLVVYTKNTSSISLKWEPPYPPYGILEKYKIEYSEDKFDIAVTPCKIWPHLHCAILQNLSKEKYYKIEISVKNQGVAEFGKSVTVIAQTKIDHSEPPYDLKVEWTQENDLTLEWKHPNITNGDIKSFDITIVPERKPLTITRTKNVDNIYNLTYYYEIGANEFLPTTTYDVTIVVDNGEKGFPATMKTKSPPDIPKLLNEPKFESTNDSITIDLSFEKTAGASNGYKVYVLTPDQDSNAKQKKFSFQNMKIVSNCTLNTTTSPSLKIILGQNEDKPSTCKDIENPPLTTGTPYNITIVVINTFENISRKSVFSYIQSTQGEPPISDSYQSLFGLLALLLIIPLLAVIYVKRHDLMSFKNNFFKENNISREVLDLRDEEVPLAHVPDTNVPIPPPKKTPKIHPKPTTELKGTKKIYSKPIKITEFEEYVKESIKSGELERQHALFPRGQTKPWNYGVVKENKSKNRYNNLIAYDHSRVILEKIDGQPYSDYVNANYIHGHKVNKAYIATQGPKAATLDDFWRMIWQENVRYIANLANIYEGGKKKVEKYWPDINETLEFGSITVQHVTQTVFADYEHRIFTVSFNGESRKVEQLHFSSWPDHGVPLYSQSLVPFLQKLLQIPLSTKSPIVVHCSAGVGRTGTILLCDISLRMAARESTIDALRTLQLLREQRPNMVDNTEQYKLAHLVVLECLMGLHTAIKCTEIETYVENLSESTLTSQMKYLQDTQWQDQAMKTVGQTGDEPMVITEKNRFEEIIPEIQGRIFLSRCPLDDETSSYINAVKVDGFRCPGRFVVTQQPLPNTLGDFWRLVNENTTTTYAVIVSLNKINPKNKTSCHFWPTTSNPLMNPVPQISLQHVNTLRLEYYDVITVHLHSDARKEFLQVQIIAFKNWEPRNLCPTNIKDFISFWEQMSSAGRGTNPIFVTCYDGVTASGLFVAMSFIIEKMKLEQVCDVCQAVRNVRHNRPQFVQKIEQFEFLYKAAVLYIIGFDSYANFN